MGRWEPVFLAIHPMASASLCCPIRRVVVLVPSGSSKPASSARLSLHFGSRGRAVQKPRLMPLRTAQRWLASSRLATSAWWRCSEATGLSPGLLRGLRRMFNWRIGAEGLVRVASSGPPCVQDCVADCTGGLVTREPGLSLRDLCQEHLPGLA